jgi:hypothetical protein
VRRKGRTQNNSDRQCPFEGRQANSKKRVPKSCFRKKKSERVGGSVDLWVFLVSPGSAIPKLPKTAPKDGPTLDRNHLNHFSVLIIWNIKLTAWHCQTLSVSSSAFFYSHLPQKNKRIFGLFTFHVDQAALLAPSRTRP